MKTFTKASQFLVLVLTVALTACSMFTPLCFAQKRFVAVAASKAAEFGKCKRPSLIERDFNAVLSKVTSCKVQQTAVETGMIADIVCPPLSGFIGAFAGSKVPAEYQCDPSMTAEAFAKAFEFACRQIPVDVGFNEPL